MLDCITSKHPHCWLRHLNSPTTVLMKQVGRLADSDNYLQASVYARVGAATAALFASLEATAHLVLAGSLVLTTLVKRTVVLTATLISWAIWAGKCYIYSWLLNVGKVHWAFRVVTEVGLFITSPVTSLYLLAERVRLLLWTSSWDSWFWEQGKRIDKIYSRFHNIDHAQHHSQKAVAFALCALTVSFLNLVSPKVAHEQFNSILGLNRGIGTRIRIQMKRHWGKLALLVGLVGLVTIDYKRGTFAAPADYLTDLQTRGDHYYQVVKDPVIAGTKSIWEPLSAWLFAETADWNVINKMARNFNSSGERFERLEAELNVLKELLKNNQNVINS